MAAIAARPRARELAHRLWHDLQAAPGRRIALADSSQPAVLARELQELLFGGEEQHVSHQVVCLRPGRYLAFDGSGATRHVRVEGGPVTGGLDVDLGDPLADAQAAIARLRAIPV